MKILLTIGLIIAAWHFVYEGIIAPSIRMHLRNKLFALRDELRAAKAVGIAREDEQAFWFVHDGINNFLNRLPGLTMERTRRLRSAYESDSKLRDTLKAHLDKVLSAEDPVIRSVFDRTNEVIRIAFVTNAGGWFIYIVPLACSILLMGSLTKAAKWVLLAPTSAIERLIPMRPVAV